MGKLFSRILLGMIVCLGFAPGVSAAGEAPFNWTGFYIGAEGGGGGATTKQTNLNTGGTRGDFNQSGGLVGGTLGYNWQQGAAIFGVETDLAWAHINGKETDCGPAFNETCPTEARAFGTIRGRAGVAISNASMLYATGGLAYADIRAFKEATNITGGEDWRTTWTAGGGFETFFAPHVSLKLEYLFATFDGNATTYTIVANGNRIAATEKDMHIIRAGINWHF